MLQLQVEDERVELLRKAFGICEGCQPFLELSSVFVGSEGFLKKFDLGHELASDP